MRNLQANSLTNLNVFMAVVGTKNFSSAARELQLPPSSISRRIGAMEERLGVALFKRTTRDVSLTEAGIAYAASVERILSDLREADLSVSRFAKLPEGKLVIESRPGLSAWLLAPLLPEFLASYPTLEVDLRLTNDTLETLSPGSDVGIRYGLAAPSSLVTRKIATTRQATYAAPAYLERHGTPRTPDDLVSHNCLAFSYGEHKTNWRYRQKDYDRVISPRGNFRSNDVTTLGVATTNAVGISVAHDWVMASAVEQGRVVPILTEYDVTTMDTFDLHVSAIYSPAVRNVQKVRVFIDFLLNVLRTRNARGAPAPALEVEFQ
jgi:DNA-binding transcriptional LysR family regulator